MLKKFFKQPKVLARLNGGLLGPHLPALASDLEKTGYSAATIQRHMRAADHFGRWLLKQKISVCDITQAVIERYIDGLGRLHSDKSPACGRLPHTAFGLRHMNEILARQGVLTVVTSQPQTTVDQWICDYDWFLDHVAGCTQKTRENYVSYALRLFNEVFVDHEVDWSKLTAIAISGFVRQQAAKLKNGGMPVTAIRSLLRFLAARGAVSDGLRGAVPAVLTWRHSSLPRAISTDEVARVVAACDSASEYGFREKAIVLLLARLGLRAGEVIRLRIDDIDWVRGCVLVPAGKNRRERCLPLSQEVGDALVAYLRQARPAMTPHRELFLRWKAPFRPLRSSVSICNLTQKLLKRAGISVQRPGSHLLRHSLATGMVINGVTFKTVADVLGHQSLASTEIYAKLDLRSLAQVAMPWPGGCNELR